MKRKTSELSLDGRRLLRLYSYYSLFLALLIVALRTLDASSSLFAADFPNASLAASIIYVVMAALFVAVSTVNPDVQIATSYIFAESVILTIIMLSAGGLESGLSSLILIPVVIGNLIAPGILGVAIAAWVTIAVLAIEHFWGGNLNTEDLAASGTYGLLAFLIAGVTQALARRLNTALAIATSQSHNLERLRNLTWQAMLDSPTAVVACNAKNRVIFFNQKAVEWLDIEQNQLIPPFLLPKSQPTPEAERVDFNGRTLRIEVLELASSEPGDYLIYIDDQSAIDEAAQQLKLASLGRLTASIAHEIRNPLSALRQASQLLAETPGLEKSERYLTQVMDQHCMRINRIIEDVLDLSRRHQPEREKIQLAIWLAEFSEQLKVQWPDIADNIQVECNPDVVIIFDSQHLNQILYNLCDNAKRYARMTPDSCPILIRVQPGKDDKVLLDVSDNGPGIAETEAAHLFEPFFTTEHDGTGLGLYICKDLCVANGASIRWHPVPLGTCFRITMKAEV